MALPNKLEVSYSIWQSSIAALNVSISYVTQSDGLVLYAGNKDFYVETFVLNDSSDLEHFNTNFLANAESVLNEDEALLRCISSLDSIKRDGYGNPIFAPSYMVVSELARLKGFKFTPDPGVPTIFDIEVTTQLLVQGGQFWVRNAGPDDYADFSVIDKDNILGYHTMYSLPSGYPVELAKYVDPYFFPSGDFNDNIEMPTVAPVTEGLYLRIVYFSTGEVSPTMAILYKWYEGGM